MIPKIRAWDKKKKTMYNARQIDFRGEEFCSSENERIKFDNVIFMQTTGFKDKNGTEIYEGDILRYGSIEISMTGEVMIKQGEVRLYSGVLCWSLDALIRDGGVKNTLVIGNIYETPELRRNLNDSKEM